MSVLRLDDLNPDGVHIRIDWSQFRPGYSVFIPCLALDEGMRQVRAIAERKKWTIDTRIWVSNNILGLRVWRVA